MATYLCEVSIEYGIEKDGDMPRAVLFDEADPEAVPRVDIYGELNLVLRSGAMTFEPAIWEVADSLDIMFTTLAADLVECGTAGREVRSNNQRDFRLRREG